MYLIRAPRALGSPLLMLFLMLFAFAASGCADHGDPAGSAAQTNRRINNGAPETGHDSVVYILHQQGSGCTGTIIGQRVVLTAKHCVVHMDSSGNAAGMLTESGFGIWIGPSPNIYSWNPKYTVEETRTTPGSTITDNDIAVIIVDGLMEETPYPIISSYPSGFIGSQVHLIGYGLDACTGGDAGTKLRTTDQVAGFEGYNSFVTQGLGANSGDSGGPVFNLDYEVVGVMVAVPQSYGGELQCGTTICTRLDRFQSLIQQALEDTGGCYPTGDEICDDGIDQDCNGLIDDGCNAIGEPCSSHEDCATGVCVDFGSGQVCAQACDPTNPTGSCVQGYYCKELDCTTGACAPGTNGTKLPGERCSVDTECQTLYCRAAADGFSYCALRCALNEGECLPSEVCAPMGDTCGACQLSTVYQGQRGIGEICQLGANCRSGLCIEDAGAFYCSENCADHASCPDGFHCREGRCARGHLGTDGDPCVLTEDCLDPLVCYVDGADAYCTRDGCESTGCPAGMVCTPTDTSSVCALQAAPVGARCDGPQQCHTQGCLTFNGEGLCTIQCSRDEPCPPGTYCTESDSGQLACAPNSLPPRIDTGDGGGGGSGGCRTAAGGSAPWALLLGGGLLLGWRRRRPRG